MDEEIDICSICNEEIKGDDGMINTIEHGLIHTHCEDSEVDEDEENCCPLYW